MTASIVDVDFSKTKSVRQLPSGVLRGPASPRENDVRPVAPDGTLLTPRQIRARARRRAKKPETKMALTDQEFKALYKPIEEWDLEELARGCPRNVDGNWPSRVPSWIDKEVHERAMERFGEVIKSRMNQLGVKSLDTLEYIMENDAVDHRGKPIVPPSTQMQAAQFLLEHIVGKPKQHVQQDISVKLQAILGSVMVNPNEALAPPSQGGTFGDTDDNIPGYQLAHLPGQTIPFGVDEDEIVEGEVLE